MTIMQQVIFEVIFPSLASLLMLGASFIIGNFVFEKLKVNSRYGFLFNFSVSSILGFGLVANLSLVLSFLHILNTFVVWFIILAVLIIGRKKLIFLKSTPSFLKNFKLFNFLEKFLMFLIVSAFLFYLVSAFPPPYKNDAIAYHLPNALEIANGNLLSLGGFGQWSGNMPILMETLFSWLYRMGGFNLINLGHYQILLLLLVLVYSVVKTEFSRLAGLLAVVFIFGLHPLLTHSTDAYIYGGLLAFELSGIVLFFLWTKYNERNLLILSGAMYGLALASKYTPLYSFLVIIILFIFFSFWRRASKREFILDCLSLFIPAFLTGGFWYIKNLILLRNPFYPFIFNHKGISDDFFKEFAFDSRYKAGASLVESSLLNFLLLPRKLFWSPYYATSLVSFLFFPLGLLIKENRALFRLMMFFTIAFFALWFFQISHVIVYGLPAVAMLLIVGGITIAWLIQNKFQRVFDHWAFKILAVASLFLFGVLILLHKNNHVVSLKAAEIKYSLGIIGKSEFYRLNQLGELFEASDFLNKNFSNTKIINNWEDFNLFLENGNKYVSLSDYVIQGGSASAAEVCKYIVNNKINFILINSELRSRVVNEEWNRIYHPEDSLWKKLEFLEENVIVPNSRLIFEKYNGKLYRLNPC